MNITERQIRLCNGSGIVVLVLKITLPLFDSEYISAFYSDIECSFEERVRTEFLSHALAAYENSTDRRKRYRYIPSEAVFLCRPCADNEYELILGYDGNILLNERHMWQGNVIIKRKRNKAK